ncbi:dystrophin-like protein [Dinothrombium tinctorium]|uniref:Dystrophin-like protein n=1 Tax=Dinothrombium tinctorium TaxID=1965070 RepID=A0A443RIK3_9ACAR|nr:dystrophin-like protein [Dinothrombium tinctorium]
MRNEREFNALSLIEQVMKSRWEQLKCEAEQTLSSEVDEESVMASQQKQLDDFKKWLMSAEDNISRFTEIAADLDSVKQQLYEHREFQNEVVKQQDVVNSLANIVFLDDSGNVNVSDSFADELEDQLVALDEKWSHVRRFVEERGAILEQVVASWEALEEEEVKFNQWMTKLDKRLTQMEDAAEETLPGSSFTLELAKRLQKMEKELEMQHLYYSKIADEGQELLAKIDKSSPASVEIARKLERLSQVWDATIQRMDNLGLLITKLSEASPVESSIHIAAAGEKHELSSQQTTNSTATSAKKRRLDSWRVQEWKKALDTITNWLERVEVSLGIDDESEDGSLLWEQLALEEQQVLLEDTENDVEIHKHEFEELIVQGKQIRDELKQFDEDSSNLEDVLNSIEDRWMEVNRTLNEKRFRVKALMELNRIHSECDAMTRVLESHKKWLHSAEANLDNINDLCKIYDQSKLRVKSMISQRERVTKIIEEVEKLCKDIPSLKNEPILSEINDFLFFWNEINTRINTLENQISEEIGAYHHSAEEKDASSPIRPQPKLLDAVDVLDSWLIKAKNVIVDDRLDLTLGNYEALEENLKQFRELEKDMLEKDNYKYITSSVQELLNSTPVAPWKSSVEKKLQNLKERWLETNSMLNTRIDKLEKLQQSLPQLEEELTSLINWVKDVNSFLSEDIAFGDMETLETQLEQCNSVLQNVEKTLLINVNNVNKKGSEIIAETDFISDAFKSELESKLVELTNSWNSVTQQAKGRKLLLEDALKKSEEIAASITEMENSVITSEREFNDIQISSISDLKSQASTLKSFNEKLKSKYEKLEELKQLIDSHSSQSSITGSMEEMKEKVIRIENNLKKLSEKVEEAIKINKQNSNKYGEFCHLLMMEKDWLDKLEKKLKRSPQSAADAEEISDSLDDLENFLRHRPVDRLERLQTLGNELILATVFTDTIKQNLEFIAKRWESLQRQAKSMQNELEATMTEAQQCERQVLNVQRWMSQIDITIKNILESDLSDSEVTQELDVSILMKHKCTESCCIFFFLPQYHVLHSIQLLEAELKNQKNALTALESCVKSYRTQERHEAASRLEEQLKLLNVSCDIFCLLFTLHFS